MYVGLLCTICLNSNDSIDSVTRERPTGGIRHNVGFVNNNGLSWRMEA